MKAIITLNKGTELVVWIFPVTLEQVAGVYTLSKARPLGKGLSVQAVEVLPDDKVSSLVVPEGKNITVLDKGVDFEDLLKYLGGIHFNHSQF